MAGSIPQALSFLFHLLSAFVFVHTVAVSMRYGWVRALCLSMRVHALVSCVCALSQNKMCAVRVMGCNGISECNSRCV